MGSKHNHGLHLLEGSREPPGGSAEQCSPRKDRKSFTSEGGTTAVAPQGPASVAAEKGRNSSACEGGADDVLRQAPASNVAAAREKGVPRPCLDRGSSVSNGTSTQVSSVWCQTGASDRDLRTIHGWGQRTATARREERRYCE